MQDDKLLSLVVKRRGVPVTGHVPFFFMRTRRPFNMLPRRQVCQFARETLYMLSDYKQSFLIYANVEANTYICQIDSESIRTNVRKL